MNQPGDRYEQEADAIANRVVGSGLQSVNKKSAPSLSTIGSSLQRKCAHCEEEEKKKLYRKEAGHPAAGSATFSEADLKSNTGGQRLQSDTLQFMENAFDSNFSRVQIHNDASADRLARSVDALAFTYGTNIFFRAGQYADNTETGKKLLAHELTHVVQQSASAPIQVQRQEDKKEKKDRSDLSKAIQNVPLFDKLPEAAQEKILDEIDKAPETISKVLLDRIIDSFAPDDMKEGLKKAGEAILQEIFKKPEKSFSVCEGFPGFHEGKTKDFKGQCCVGNIESEQACCPKDRFAPMEASRPCCPAGDVVGPDGKCFTPPPIDISTICFPPAQKDKSGRCCMPPLMVIDGVCQMLPQPKPSPPAVPISFRFSMGVIDGYEIGKSTVPQKKEKQYQAISDQIKAFMTACPASFVFVTGHTDKPGSDEANQVLGERRADQVRDRLAIDMAAIHFGSMPATIFSSSEGESNPVEHTAENVYSAANRRVEIEFQSICPPLGEFKPDFRPLQFPKPIFQTGGSDLFEPAF